MEIRFTVGELARLGGVTKQMLIYYDNEGVFQPKYVDETNRYRYYTADQVEELDSILILREMGFSLKEIKAHMQRRGGEQTLQLLREQRRVVEEKLANLSLIHQRLDRKIETLEHFFTPQTDDGWLTRQPEEHLAVEPVEGACGLVEVDLALKQLLRRAQDEGVPHFYQLGDIVPREHLLSGDYLHFSYAFLPLQGTCPDHVPTKIKPEGLYACRYHVGSYQDMGKTYTLLLGEIQAGGYRVAGPSYEFCVLDCLSSKSPSEYITEIQIPVEKAHRGRKDNKASGTKGVLSKLFI